MDQCLAPVAFTAPAVFRGGPAPDGTRTFSGVAYGGGIVTDHPFLPAVAFDLASTALNTPAPALFGHFDPIGVIEEATIGDRIEIGGKLFADLDGNAKKIAAMADRGLPWQLSVGIWPGRIEEIRAGAKVQLNGRTFEGPLAIFRDNRVREVSFVALGADDKTTATVFAAVSEGGRRPSAQPTEPKMPEISKEEHDRVVAELTAQLATECEATKQAQERIAELESRFAADQRARRVAAVKELFTALGREFSDDKAKPYIAMDDEAFATVAADLRAKLGRHPALFSEYATGGAPSNDGASADDIAKRAHEFIADQRTKSGREFSVADAVAHVTGRIKLA
jgi:hypothetical protein